MSFTSEIKRELLSRKNESSCCEYAMLSAYLHGALSVVKNNSGYGFEVQTDSDFLANYCVNTIQKLFGEEVGYYAVKKDKLQGRERFVMKYSSPRCREILQELGFLSKGEEAVLLSGINFYLLENDCCRRAYIKGAFLGEGRLLEARLPAIIYSSASLGTNTLLLFAACLRSLIFHPS